MAEYVNINLYHLVQDYCSRSLEIEHEKAYILIISANSSYNSTKEYLTQNIDDTPVGIFLGLGQNLYNVSSFLINP